MMKQPSLTRVMKAYAIDAVGFARREYGAQLDYSEKSIRLVEDIINDLYNQLPRTKTGKLSKRGYLRHTIDGICNMFGGYIGEVVRENIGGRWKLESINSGESIVTLQVRSIRIFPPSKVYKRLANGSADDLWFYYKAFKETLKEETEGTLYGSGV